MTKPTDDEVLTKAKKLAHDDGKLWLWKTEGIKRAPAPERGRSDDDTLRAEYLVRVRSLLGQGEDFEPRASLDCVWARGDAVQAEISGGNHAAIEPA